MSDKYTVTKSFKVVVDGVVLGGRFAESSFDINTGNPTIVAIHGGTYTSAYFDVPGHSLMDNAIQNGFNIIAIDRPGYGVSTPLEDAPDLIQKNAEHLNNLLPAVLRELGFAGDPVFLIGHSIGGAIVISMAALRPAWKLSGIAVSGVGIKTPPADAENYAHLPQQYFVELPTPMKDVVMFGPPETVPPDMPAASYIANTTVPRSELTDITGGFGERLASLAANVQVPLHYRQGAHEKLWLVSEKMIQDFGKLFSSAGKVDVGLVSDSGHCIDFHKCGKKFQMEQLAFAARLKT